MNLRTVVGVPFALVRAIATGSLSGLSGPYPSAPVAMNLWCMMARALCALARDIGLLPGYLSRYANKYGARGYGGLY